MEDGSNTDNRLGVAELILAPHATGPPAHWHEMHDETFLVTKGTVRFFGAGVKDFQGKVLAEPHGKEAGEKDEVAMDVGVGDYVTVGTRAPHTFANPSGQEARFINTFTPAFYVNYFKLMSDLLQVRSHPISNPPPFAFLRPWIPLAFIAQAYEWEYIGRTLDAGNQHAGYGFLCHYSGREAQVRRSIIIVHEAKICDLY